MDSQNKFEFFFLKLFIFQDSTALSANNQSINHAFHVQHVH
jgi:hypothetical protein